MKTERFFLFIQRFNAIGLFLVLVGVAAVAFPALMDADVFSSRSRRAARQEIAARARDAGFRLRLGRPQTLPGVAGAWAPVQALALLEGGSSSDGYEGGYGVTRNFLFCDYATGATRLLSSQSDLLCRWHEVLETTAGSADAGGGTSRGVALGHLFLIMDAGHSDDQEAPADVRGRVVLCDPLGQGAVTLLDGVSSVRECTVYADHTAALLYVASDRLRLARIDLREFKLRGDAAVPLGSDVQPW